MNGIQSDALQDDPVSPLRVRVPDSSIASALDGPQEPSRLLLGHQSMEPKEETKSHVGGPLRKAFVSFEV